MPPRQIDASAILAQLRRDWVRVSETMIRSHVAVGQNPLPLMVRTLQEAGVDLGLAYRTPWRVRLAARVARTLKTLRSRTGWMALIGYQRVYFVQAPGNDYAKDGASPGYWVSVAGPYLDPTDAREEQIALDRAFRDEHGAKPIEGHRIRPEWLRKPKESKGHPVQPIPPTPQA